MIFSFKLPALFVTVSRERLAADIRHFMTQGSHILFSNSQGMGNEGKLEIKSVYFKLEGEERIDYKADLVALNSRNSREHSISRGVGKGKDYYIKNLRFLKEILPVNELKDFSTNKRVGNHTFYSGIIQDPMKE